MQASDVLVRALYRDYRIEYLGSLAHESLLAAYLKIKMNGVRRVEPFQVFFLILGSVHMEQLLQRVCHNITSRLVR